jgi:hypothetical protein
MATLNLGRIKPVFRGAYSGATAYVVDDIVTHGNESFICIQAHGAGTQATSVTAYWTKLAAKGTDGTDVGTTITAQGDILYRDGSGLQKLAKPASDMYLKNTSAGTPSWAAVSSDIVKLAYQDIDGTGASSYEFQNCFSAANDLLYSGYKLNLHVKGSVHNGYVYVRFMTGTNTEISGGTDYRRAGAVGYRQTDNANNILGTSNDADGADSMGWGGWGFGQSGTASQGNFTTTDITGDMYGGTDRVRCMVGISTERDNSSPNYIIGQFLTWRCENSGNITGMKFFTPNGNFINGEITLWGFKK